MIKIKFRKILTISMIFLLCMFCLSICFINTGEVVYADSAVYKTDIDELCRQMTESTKFVVDGEEKNITEYESYINKTFQPTNLQNLIIGQVDNWILNIVPKELFVNKVRDYFYIGESYGFYFNYNNQTDKYFVYLMLHKYENEIKGHVVRRIEPLYYESYVFDEVRGVATLPYYVEERQYDINKPETYTVRYYYKYSMYHKVFLKNVAFNGFLYNLNHYNQGEEKYNAQEDNGGFFIGGSYIFNGVSMQSGKNDFLADMFFIALGCLGSKKIDAALTLKDSYIAIKDFYKDFKNDFRDQISNDKFIYNFKVIESYREAQIEKYNNLLKSYVSALYTPNDKNGVMFGINNNSYIETDFLYNINLSENLSNTGFVGKIKIDIVEEVGIIAPEIRVIAQDVESKDYKTDLKDSRNIILSDEEIADVYTFAGKTCPMEFTAPTNGVVTFETIGEIKNKFEAEFGEIKDKEDNLNQTLSVELEKGQVYEFKSRNLSSKKGIYQIKVEFIPSEILLGESKTFTLMPGESEYYTFNNPEGKGFNYSLSSKGNYTVNVLYSNKTNVVQSVSMQNKKASAIAKCEKGRYFIQIINNSDSNVELQFSILSISFIDIGQSNDLEIGHKALYEIKQVRENSRMNFELTLPENMQLTLLDGNFDIVEKDSIISNFEFNAILEKNKSYYIYIENDNESEKKTAVKITYQPYELTFGNNRRLTYGYDAMTYELSLATDTSISLSAKDGVSLSVFDSNWSQFEACEGKYYIVAQKSYYIAASGMSDILELDITHESTDEYNGTIGGDGFIFINFIPDSSDRYDVFGVSKYEWYDRNLVASQMLNAGDLYYLKIYGESNAPYNITIEKRINYLRLLSERVLKSGMYCIEVDEDATYVISTTVRNDDIAWYNLLDSQKNIICSNQEAGGKFGIQLKEGKNYIEIYTDTNIGILVYKSGEEGIKSNNALELDSIEIVELLSNNDNTYIIDAKYRGDYTLQISYVVGAITFDVNVLDDSLNIVEFQKEIEYDTVVEIYKVKMHLEKGKHYVTIGYTQTNTSTVQARLSLSWDYTIEKVYLTSTDISKDIVLMQVENGKEIVNQVSISMGRTYILHIFDNFKNEIRVIWELVLPSNDLIVNKIGTSFYIETNPAYESSVIRIKIKDFFQTYDLKMSIKLPYSVQGTLDNVEGVYTTNLIDNFRNENYRLIAFIEKIEITVGVRSIIENGNICTYLDMYKKGLDIFAGNASIKSAVYIRFYESGESYSLSISDKKITFCTLDNFNSAALSHEAIDLFIDVRSTALSNTTYNIPAKIKNLFLIGSSTKTLNNIRFNFDAREKLTIYLLNYNVIANRNVVLDFSQITNTNVNLMEINRITGTSVDYLIKAKAIVFEGQDGSLQVIGSNGENGANGAKAGSNSYSAGENGGNGDDGLKGENGTGALSCTSVANKGDCSILLQGGNGGNGGYGRNGGTGGHGRTNAVKGGAGGRGGDGGDGGYGGVGCPVSPTEGIIDIIKGKPGCGGDGGSGGYGGSGSDGVVCRINGEFEVVYSYSGGVGGNGGNAGECGAGDHACKLPAGGAGGNGGYGGDGASYQEGKDFKYTGASAGGRGGNGGTGCIGGDGGHGGHGGTGAKGLNATLTSNGGDGYRGGSGGNGGNGGNYYEVDGHGGAAGDGGYGGEGGEGGEKKSVFKGGAKGPDGSSGSNGAAGKYVAPGSNTGESSGGDSCVATGTLITLADGRQVPVETLKGDEMLLVWDIFNGKFEISPILFVDKDEERMYNIINLRFSDGTSVKVIDEHGFWDFDLNKYVFLREDADKYIGHYFNKQTVDEEGNFGYTKVRLEEVEITQEYTAAWSPVTYGHLCYYVNGMLSMPGATGGLINIFDVDAKTMTVDKQAYEFDIELYGLYTYEEFSSKYEIPQEIFEAFGGKYLKAAIGKGLITEDEISALITRYSAFWQAND